MSEVPNRTPDSNASVPATVQRRAVLASEAAYAELSIEARQALALQHLEQQLKLGASAQEAEQKNDSCSQALGDFVHHISALERQTRSDIGGVVETDNAFGKTKITYSKNNNTVIIVNAITVAVLAFLILSR